MAAEFEHGCPNLAASSKLAMIFQLKEKRKE
jgi:hypothetical protein